MPKCSIVRTREEGDAFIYYRVAFDGVEAASTVRINKTQYITHGEDILLSWCNHHADQLTAPGVVVVNLDEEIIK